MIYSFHPHVLTKKSFQKQQKEALSRKKDGQIRPNQSRVTMFYEEGIQKHVRNAWKSRELCRKIMKFVLFKNGTYIALKDIFY